MFLKPYFVYESLALGITELMHYWKADNIARVQNCTYVKAGAEVADGVPTLSGARDLRYESQGLCQSYVVCKTVVQHHEAQSHVVWEKSHSVDLTHCVLYDLRKNIIA